VADEHTLGAIDDALWSLFGAVVRSPIPVVAALNGHAHGAGAVLATLCDRRVLSEEGTLRFNHASIGLEVPPFLHATLHDLIGGAAVRPLLVLAERVDAQRALSMGLVDAVVTPKAVVATAIEDAECLLRLPRASLLATRRLMRQTMVDRFANPFARGRDIREQWGSPDLQRRVRGALARSVG